MVTIQRVVVVAHTSYIPGRPVPSQFELVSDSLVTATSPREVVSVSAVGRVNAIYHFRIMADCLPAAGEAPGKHPIVHMHFLHQYNQ